MSDTPRTDAAEFVIPILSDQGLPTVENNRVVDPEFARLLEREVKVLVEALENLTKWNGHHNGPTLIELMKHADEALASIKEPT
jgi:hypothetical protein